MRVKIVPSTSDGRFQLLTTYLINDSVAIDAGAIAVGLTHEEQRRLRSIIITHAHLDHVASLPLFLTDLFDEIETPVRVHATPEDYEAITTHLFNERVWIPLHTMENSRTRLIEHVPLRPGENFETEGLRITPIPVTHAVATLGLLVEDDRGAVLFTSDTGPTEEIWQQIQGRDRLRAIFIDISYPDRLTWLAELSGHHSPETLRSELPKMEGEAPIFAVHLKPAYHDQVVAELARLNHPRVQVAEIGRIYNF